MVRRLRLFAVTFMLMIVAVANAQVTTASLGGRVIGTDKEAIIGATVQAFHEPSGTQYGAITNIDGRYTIQGMQASSACPDTWDW